MVCFSKTLITHLPNTIFQAWCQSSQFFCYLKFLILCPLLSCWPPLKITWCELLVVSFLSSYVAHVCEICLIHCHISFLNIVRLGQFYDILSALVMKHMARGVGIGRWRKKCGKCNISQGKGAGNMTCKMEESMSIATEIPSVSIQIIILKLYIFLIYAIMYRIQGPKHIIVFATNQSSCCQTCGNSTKRKGEGGGRARMLLHFHFYFSLKKRHLFYIIFIGV